MMYGKKVVALAAVCAMTAGVTSTTYAATSTFEMRKKAVSMLGIMSTGDLQANVSRAEFARMLVNASEYSAAIYSQNLAGKVFLYVYGEEFFEVSFPVDHFLHLTGVETKLSAKDFYKNAKKGKLTNNQFYFNERHPYANAKKKLPCLKRLPELTNDMVCILKDM